MGLKKSRKKNGLQKSKQTLFSYKNGSTLIHKIPAIIKIFFLIVFSAATFFDSNENSVEEIFSISVLLRTGICFFISILIFFLAKSEFSNLKKLSFIFVLGIFITIAKLFSIPNPQILSLEEYENQMKFTLEILPDFFINLNGLFSGILYTVRFFSTTLLALVVFETTSSIQIKESLENLENFLAKIFPFIKKMNFSLVISLAINFIPQVFEKYNCVKIASFARSPSKKNFNSKLRTFFVQMQSLLSCLLYQAEITRKAVLNRKK